MVKRRIFLGCTVGIALWMGASACAGILGFERLSEEGSTEGGPLPDGAPDALADVNGEGGDPQCGRIGVPDEPLDASLDAGGAIRVAIKLFDLGIDQTQGLAGLNLDKTCTSGVGSSSCTTTVDGTNFARYGVDKLVGIDNAGAALLDDVGQVGESFSPPAINERLAAGEYGLVITVLDWNGLDDDTSVRLEMFPALRVTPAADGGTKPSFSNTDEWIRDARFELIPNSDTSTNKAVRAYVTKGQLVGYFDQLVLHVSSPEDPKKIDIKLREAWVTAKIVNDDTGAHLANGIGGGRWATIDLLKEVRSIYVKETGPFKNFFVCDNTGKLFYDAVKDKVCKARDIRTASRDDNAGRPCDAFSVGLQFDTYRVDKIGVFENGDDGGARCVDAAVPEGDECP